MKIPLEAVIQLLHSSTQGSLATLSQALPGYPFASALPFVVDENQCPVFLVSRLAEHTRNLRVDARASLLIQALQHPDPQAAARMTLIGDAHEIDAGQDLIRRYLRYHPDAERYLALGDFTFFRLTPQRIRLIAGFGQMGWVEAEDLETIQRLPLEQETGLLARCTENSGLICIDCYGVDRMENGILQRISYPRKMAPEQLPVILRDLGFMP